MCWDATPIDRGHYVVKQVKAVAEPVLETLELDFDHATGNNLAV
jgi:hypothetical protein